MYEKCLDTLEQAHARLCGRVAPPKKVWAGNAYTYRFEEKSLEQALVQLLARVVTGLRAAHLLLANGFLQEQVCLQRTLHELEENVFLLSFGRLTDRLENVHEQFLKAFYQEPLASPFAEPGTKKFKPPARPAIRDWIARAEVSNSDTIASSDAVRHVYKIGSGYVHAASAQILELYDGAPPQWQLRGTSHGQLYGDHTEDIWNYYYRGLLSFSFSAKAMGDDALFDDLRSFAQEFAVMSGKNYFASS